MKLILAVTSSHNTQGFENSFLRTKLYGSVGSLISKPASFIYVIKQRQEELNGPSAVFSRMMKDPNGCFVFNKPAFL